MLSTVNGNRTTRGSGCQQLASSDMWMCLLVDPVQFDESSLQYGQWWCYMMRGGHGYRSLQYGQWWCYMMRGGHGYRLLPSPELIFDWYLTGSADIRWCHYLSPMSSATLPADVTVVMGYLYFLVEYSYDWRWFTDYCFPVSVAGIVMPC